MKEFFLNVFYVILDLVVVYLGLYLLSKIVKFIDGTVINITLTLVFVILVIRWFLHEPLLFWQWG